MPELPEVETVCRGMETAIAGRTIKAVRLNRAGLRTPFPAGLERALQGRKIKACYRRAKYILVDLAGDQILVPAPWHVGADFFDPEGQCL